MLYSEKRKKQQQKLGKSVAVFGKPKKQQQKLEKSVAAFGEKKKQQQESGE